MKNLVSVSFFAWCANIVVLFPVVAPKDKTLSDNDIDQISKKIISAVQDSTGATLRS